MISAHRDEVGFIIKGIDDDGYVKFETVGGIDDSVLCGRNVILGNEEKQIKGVIASKAIHHQKADERKKPTSVENMYIDIGSRSKSETEEYLSIGDYGIFDSDFVEFGDDEKNIKAKAIDDRLGCAVMIETMRKIKNDNVSLPFDIYFAFTVREEIGLSGALTAANIIAPDYSLVLESTAIADLPNVPKNSRVAEVGSGAVISFADRSTIYGREFIDFAMNVARVNDIPAQIKRYISGGNDAGHIHKSGVGVRTLAISAPTRYLHSASCVCSLEDYSAIKNLVYQMLICWNI
jgi:endoglucanase